ncbi:hypothetical protein HID58_029346, partial [Brassica napus]
RLSLSSSTSSLFLIATPDIETKQWKIDGQSESIKQHSDSITLIYKMIEGAKQRMMIELKKQRMETAKELELQQMKIWSLKKSNLGKHRAAASEWNFPSVKDAADVVIATMMSGIQEQME